MPMTWKMQFGEEIISMMVTLHYVIGTKAVIRWRVLQIRGTQAV